MHKHSHNKVNIVLPILAVILVLVFFPFRSRTANDDFLVGEVTEIVSSQTQKNDFFETSTQSVKVVVLKGAQKNSQIEAEYSIANAQNKKQFLEIGDKVVLKAGEDQSFTIVDRYRLPALALLGAIFALVTFFLLGPGAISAFLGLILSIIVLNNFIVAKIVEGGNPFLITILGSLIIATLSVFLAHGFKKKTAISVISIILTLSIALVLSLLFVGFAGLFGFGSEEAFYLQTGIGAINLQGLLLAGIIIGTLGVLDDVTTTQVTAVAELKIANKKLGVRELYKSGITIGKEHIASLINTLVLAYAGASLPLFVLLYQNTDSPFWTFINSEFFAEEIVRTLIGSLALILAVPISTYLAAWMYGRKNALKDPECC